MKKHLVTILILIFAILFLPYWIYLPLLLVAIVISPFFWEAIILALLIEGLYGPDMHGLPSLISPLALIPSASARTPPYQCLTYF